MIKKKSDRKEKLMKKKYEIISSIIVCCSMYARYVHRIGVHSYLQVNDAIHKT